MNFRQLAELLKEEAKSYRNGELKNTILPSLGVQKITTGGIKKVLRPYVEKVLEKIPTEDTRDLVEKRFKTFSRNGLDRIRLNVHMHDFEVSAGTNFINQDSADALLVGFINDAVAPLDLALYAEDLVEKQVA